MSKMKVQDATKELSRRAAKLLGDVTGVRTAAEKTLAELRKIENGFTQQQEAEREEKRREEQQKAMVKRDPSNKDAQVIVGMGTCGIAAGAKDTFNAIIEELDAKGISHVLVSQTGCMGLCHSEPTVEVIVPHMPVVIYGNVDAETARKIVNQHIVRKLLVNDHIFDKPAADIIRK